MKITLKIKVIKGREFKAACTAAEAVVATQALKDTTPYVPALTGAFSNLARVDGNEIVYTGDQAAYLYAGRRNGASRSVYQGRGMETSQGRKAPRD